MDRVMPGPPAPPGGPVPPPPGPIDGAPAGSVPYGFVITAAWAWRLANAHRNAIENLVVFAPLALAAASETGVEHAADAGRASRPCRSRR